MKKLVLLAVVCLFAVTGFINAQSYGILVNGNKYYPGTLNPTPMDPSFTEYQCLGVPVKNGDFLQLYDLPNKAAWVVELDSYSVKGIEKQGDTYVCSAAACYDFYINQVRARPVVHRQLRFAGLHRMGR